MDWKICGRRRTLPMSRVLFLDRAGQLIALACRGEPWLEVWETAGKMKKVAEAALPEIIACMAASECLIALGCQSGQLILYRLERGTQHAPL
jgi:hypothetical protein